MLSISPPIAGTGHGDYYLNLAREDYYTSGGEPSGSWYGKSAEKLGLTGIVEASTLKNLMYGLTPDGTTPLVQNAGAINRQSAWDLTFSGPKSVSVYWSQSSEEVRAEVEKAHRKAVREALSYLEDYAGYSRRGKGGHHHERVSLIAATFEHSSNRALEPQLHTHALVLNVCVRDDGTSGTIESKPLYIHKMAAGALYRAELAAGLKQNLGLNLKRVNNWFEIEEISEQLVENFSTRRRDILEELERTGFSGAKASSVAALSTRKKKQDLDRNELFMQWQKVGRKCGYIEPERISPIEPISSQSLDDIKRQALERATEQSSYFKKSQFIRCLAEESQVTGLGIRDILSIAENQLKDESITVTLNEDIYERNYTTKEMLELEKALIHCAKQDKHKAFSCPAVVQVYNPGAEKRLTKEQKNALEHIVFESGRIKIVSGVAGSGKSFLLKAASNLWADSNFDVLGAALSGKAAQELQEAATISSETLHRRLWELEHNKLTCNILVVDEAAMIDSRMMEKLIRLTGEQNIKIVLIGDAQQIQAIGPGGAFKELGKQLGNVELKEIYRQENEVDRDAVYSVIDGKLHEALTSFKNRDRLTVSPDRLQSIATLVEKWAIEGARSPSKHIMLVGEKSDQWKLNALAQKIRLENGLISDEYLHLNGESFHISDRILFHRNSYQFGVKNGQLGTISDIDVSEKILSILLDDGRTSLIDLNEYSHLSLGYALTTHKAQGMTVDNAYILLGGMMQDRELSYVQLSRARKNTYLFANELEAGEGLHTLYSEMSRSRQKELAISML